VGARGAHAEVRCATDKISVGNGHIFMSKGSLERGEERLPEYVANSFFGPSWLGPYFVWSGHKYPYTVQVLGVAEVVNPILTHCLLLSPHYFNNETHS
jgi:hypothetical protein